MGQAGWPSRLWHPPPRLSELPARRPDQQRVGIQGTGTRPVPTAGSTETPTARP